MAAAIHRELATELGLERASEVLERAVSTQARRDGSEARDRLGDLSLLAAIAAVWRCLSAGGALDLEIVEESRVRVCVRVTRCGYMEMYREEGCEPLGPVLSCGRDLPFFEGLCDGDAGGIRMTRASHIPAGDSYCEIVYQHEPVVANAEVPAAAPNPAEEEDE